jgi:outer membrane protein assembly factor BamB
MLTRTVDAGTYLPSVLPIEAGTAYALDYRGGLRAIRLDSGAVLWETSLSEVQGTFPSPPAVDADSIYIVSNAGHVLRLRRADASRAWKAELGIGCQLAPLAAQDALLCLGEDGFLTALDKRSGKELWSLEIGAGSACPPVIADGRVFLGDGGGHLLCLGAGKGKR